MDYVISKAPGVPQHATFPQATNIQEAYNSPVNVSEIHSLIRNRQTVCNGKTRDYGLLSLTDCSHLNKQSVQWQLANILGVVHTTPIIGPGF